MATSDSTTPRYWINKVLTLLLNTLLISGWLMMVIITVVFPSPNQITLLIGWLQVGLFGFIRVFVWGNEWNTKPSKIIYAPRPITFTAKDKAISDFYRNTLHLYPYDRGGYVYVIRDIEVSGLYKIGKSQDVRKRLTDFGAKLPFEFHIVHIVPAGNHTALETVLHHNFADKRQRGEWFALEWEDVVWIRRFEKG